MNKIPLNKPYFSKQSREKVLNYIDGILESGNLMMGEFTERFEREFSINTGVDYSITTNTCTTALQIVLSYYNVKDKEVLVPSASFITDISSIKWSGGMPVFVDMNPLTMSFDLNDLEEKLTPKTKALIWVHLTGVISSQYLEIINFCKSNNLILIEDCSHAHGAAVNNKKAGSLGDAACFSFYPGKMMTTGAGGMISTNNEKLANYSRQMRLFGRCENDGSKVCLEGNDWFMDEIRACIGLDQLNNLNDNLENRRKVANLYNKKLDLHPAISTFKTSKTNQPSYYLYFVTLDKSIDRSKVISMMINMFNVSTKRIYKPTHMEEIFCNISCVDKNTLKVTEDILSRTLCLPMFHQITTKQVCYISDSLIKCIDKLSKK